MSDISMCLDYECTDFWDNKKRRLDKQYKDLENYDD